MQKLDSDLMLIIALIRLETGLDGSRETYERDQWIPIKGLPNTALISDQIR